MKKFLTKAMTLCMLLVMALAFTGCGKEVTLEDWFKEAESDNEYKAALEEMNSSSDEAKISIDVKGNTVYYDLVYTEAIDVSDAETKELIKTVFDELFAESEAEFQATISDISKETKIKGITFSIKVSNPDGTVLYEKEIVQAE